MQNRYQRWRDIYYAKYYGKRGGEWQLGEKNEKGKRKGRKNTSKQGEKALKMHLLGLYTQKLICRGK